MTAAVSSTITDHVGAAYTGTPPSASAWSADKKTAVSVAEISLTPME